MKVHEAEAILKYYADIPQRIEIIRRQCTALSDEVDPMRGMGTDGMPRGGTPGDSTAAMACRTAEASFIFVAAQRRISLGSRPQEKAASLIRCRMAATFSAMDIIGTFFLFRGDREKAPGREAGGFFLRSLWMRPSRAGWGPVWIWRACRSSAACRQ